MNGAVRAVHLRSVGSESLGLERLALERLGFEIDYHRAAVRFIRAEYGRRRNTEGTTSKEVRNSAEPVIWSDGSIVMSTDNGVIAGVDPDRYGPLRTVLWVEWIRWN